MNIAIFGGTFDPIHVGHIRAAQAAVRRFYLDSVQFVPSGNPPHKRGARLTDFIHRYAMVALACAGHPAFVPSLLEAPRADGRPQYSIETLKKVRKHLSKGDRLYFLLGLDAFLDLPHWKEPGTLLDMADFIVASRPGFSLREILRIVPSHLLRSRGTKAVNGAVQLRRTTLNLLSGVHAAVSSSKIRQAICEGRPVTGLLPRLVEEYIVKHRFYQPDEPKARRGSER